MKGDPSLWIFARASGLLAYLLLTASVLAGLVLKLRPFGRVLRPAAVTEFHRTLALLALAATAMHGAALVSDSVSPIRLPALIAPGLSAYRPLATAAGVLAAELMLVVYVSFPLRRLIGARRWRRLHWLTYPIFAAATAHGLATGTDSGRGWVFALYAGALAAVAAATAWRALVPPAGRSPARRPTREPLPARPSA